MDSWRYDVADAVTELQRLGQEEAWWLGAALVERCRSEDLAVTIMIRLGEQRVFHAALPGTSADNDGWAERKARVVAHFGMSSLEVFERHVKDIPDFFHTFALSSSDYAPFGGAVPIKIRGTMVGILAVSGLESERDHALAVDALRDEAIFQAGGRPTTIRSRGGDDPHEQETAPASRSLQPGQRAQVWIGGPDLAEPELVLETSQMLIEAPNWSTDGASLYVNGNGQLWRVDLRHTPTVLSPVTFIGLPDINNDHVLSPDGHHIYLSAADGHIYRGALTGGAVERITHDEGVMHYLHGVSPDGTRLAYVRLADHADPGRLGVMDRSGLSEILDTGDGHLDGPEWSPDGSWIYFNTESFTHDPGHAQLARIPDGGGRMEHLVASDTVDWFPHLSPDGRFASYIAFPAGTLGHPADLKVEVRVVSTDDWSTPIGTYPVFGGQGTINVNSWSPDSTRFAFVAYPITGSSG